MENGNAQFPMPQVVGRSPYMPRGQCEQEPELFEKEAIENELPALHLRNIPRGADAIKSWLRALTHREMREMVAEIFRAHAKLNPQPDTGILAPAITAAQLPDVLDTFAHGD
jgi:hypothetical protein